MKSVNEKLDDSLRDRIERAIRIVPDFPLAHMRFRDITPILEADPALYGAIIDRLAQHAGARLTVRSLSPLRMTIGSYAR